MYTSDKVQVGQERAKDTLGGATAAAGRLLVLRLVWV